MPENLEDRARNERQYWCIFCCNTSQPMEKKSDTLWFCDKCNSNYELIDNDGVTRDTIPKIFVITGANNNERT